MRLIFLILFIFVSFPVFAADYYIYIRTYDRSGVDPENDKGRSKKGNVVQVLEATPQYVPTVNEISEYAIVRVTGATLQDLEILESEMTEDLLQEVEWRFPKADWDDAQQRAKIKSIKKMSGDQVIVGQETSKKIEIVKRSDWEAEKAKSKKLKFDSMPVEVTTKSFEVFKEAKGKTLTADDVVLEGLSTDYIVKGQAYKKVKKAYRQKKVDFEKLGASVGKIKEVTWNSLKKEISDTTEADLIAYRIKQLRYAWLERPIFRLVNIGVSPTFAATVSTINKTGEDYNTCTLWEDAKDGDKVTGMTDDDGHIYNDDGDLNDRCVFDGSTTNASYNLLLTSPSGERHAGNASSGATITKVLSDSQGVIEIRDNYITVENLIIKPNYSGDSGQDNSNGIKVVQSDESVVRRNIITPLNYNLEPWGQNDHGISVAGTDSAVDFYIINNIVYGFTDNSYNAHACMNFSVDEYRGGRMYVWNNTAYGCDKGIVFSTGAVNSMTIDVRNNIAAGNDNDFVFDADPTYSNNDYNCSDDASATGANSLTTCSISDFISATDFHLVSTAVGKDEGVNIGTTYEVDYDVDNVQRSGTWDMGADKYVVGGGASRRVMFIN